MIEYQLVPTAALHPQSCIACNTQTDPAGFIDTHGEQYIMGRDARVYICMRCVKLCARAAGLVKGAKLDELTNALLLEATKQKEVDGLTAQVQELRVKVGNEQRRVAQTQSMLEDALNRERTRAHLAAEIAGAAAQLQTVGEPVLEAVV